ncbi:hypothetical protein KJ657_04760 [Patescibacteria group bacterium]|nr:hypothetical protein [Patescibacteria group bacterium]MBU1016365.1 hypothetical protein [Patescibacteria group bacterium]MBU1685441.1 hypothetical protein [Patescibacteria group bacterium]
MLKFVIANLDIIGAFLSFSGSIALAFSISKNPGEAHQFIKGKKKYLTIIHLGLFRFGIVLLATGFGIQFLDKI